MLRICRLIGDGCDLVAKAFGLLLGLVVVGFLALDCGFLL